MRALNEILKLEGDCNFPNVRNDSFMDLKINPNAFQSYPPINWDHVPRGLNFLAMNPDGTWRAFSSLPMFAMVRDGEDRDEWLNAAFQNGDKVVCIDAKPCASAKKSLSMRPDYRSIKEDQAEWYACCGVRVNSRGIRTQ